MPWMQSTAGPFPCSRTKLRTPAAWNWRPACRWAASTSACVACLAGVMAGVFPGPVLAACRSSDIDVCLSCWCRRMALQAATGRGGAGFPVAGSRSLTVNVPALPVNSVRARPVPGRYGAQG